MGAGRDLGRSFEVVEVDVEDALTSAHRDAGSAAADAGSAAADPLDAVVTGPTAGRGVLDRWPWWRTASARARACASWTAIMLVVAGVAVVGAARQSSPVHERTRQVGAAAPPSGLDALGCPVDRTCSLRPSTALQLAVARLVPVRVVASSETFDAVTGQVYRRELRAESIRPPGQLRVVSQCAPSGVGRVPPIVDRSYTEGDGMRQRVIEVTAVSGYTHCSSFIQAVESSTHPAVGRSDVLGAVVIAISRDPNVWVGYR